MVHNSINTRFGLSIGMVDKVNDNLKKMMNFFRKNKTRRVFLCIPATKPVD